MNAADDGSRKQHKKTGTQINQIGTGATTHREDDMYEEIKARKINLGINWVKTDAGNTYLCPAGEDFSGATQEELEARCVNESHNPQND